MIKQEMQLLKERCNRKELRKFALTIAAVLGLISGVLFWKESTLTSYFFYPAALLLVSGLVLPMALKPLYIGWMSFAVVMGFFMTRVILSLLFIIVFAPAGLVIRLLGKDPMQQKIEKQRASYWIPRPQRKFVPQNMENQY